jgi:hypothetical protein
VSATSRFNRTDPKNDGLIRSQIDLPACLRRVRPFVTCMTV